MIEAGAIVAGGVPVLGCYLLPVSPPAASGQRCIIGRTGDDGRCFNIKDAHFGENIFGFVHACFAWCSAVLTEGRGSKLVFGDKNHG